ncbi:hypothetical protein EYZ11_007635 [Aspergillus tanneri]|uniref:Uncharacterized protein n=1 Tax=Aspergillus tanneri TaxID=1220188 RepID=A0A4S3JCH6_9EURO|nr:hypothetical protein EYZ11_007635 [Aspergillus tanneri]
MPQKRLETKHSLYMEELTDPFHDSASKTSQKSVAESLLGGLQI